MLKSIMLKSIKRALAFCLSMTMLFLMCAVAPVSVSAETETTIDKITYKVYDDYAAVSDADSDIVTANIKSEINGVPVTEIGDSAFCKCKSLTSATIPDSVTTIGEYSFEDCYSLTSITMPDSVTKIGGYAFDDTGYFNNDENWEYGVLYIDDCLIDANNKIPSDYTIKDGTRTIADFAFYGRDSLTSVTIPNSVINIGEEAFEDCTSLESVSIPDSVTIIGFGTFAGCHSLKSVTIGNGVTTIGDYAFLYADHSPLSRFPTA